MRWLRGFPRGNVYSVPYPPLHVWSSFSSTTLPFLQNSPFHLDLVPILSLPPHETHPANVFRQFCFLLCTTRSIHHPLGERLTLLLMTGRLACPEVNLTASTCIQHQVLFSPCPPVSPVLLIVTYIPQPYNAYSSKHPSRKSASPCFALIPLLSIHVARHQQPVPVCAS